MTSLRLFQLLVTHTHTHTHGTARAHTRTRTHMRTHTHTSNIATEQMLYTEKDLEKSMDKIETINFHQVNEANMAARVALNYLRPAIMSPGDGSSLKPSHIMSVQTLEFF